MKPSAARLFLLAAAVVWLLVTTGSAAAAAAEPDADFYVATDGNDSWSGTLAAPNAEKTDGPFATITAARDAVRRAMADKPGGGLRVLIRGGVYRIDEPITFGPEDSGREGSPNTYAAYPGERPVVSGGLPVTGWKKQGDGPVWTAVVPGVKEGTWYPRSLFVGGKRAVPARTPNAPDVLFAAGPIEPLKDRNAARRDPETRRGFRFKDEDIKPWGQLDEAVLVYYHSWTTSRHRVKSIDPAGKTVMLDNPPNWPFGWWGDNERYYVENFPDALDAPGEFTLDPKTGVLSYHPREGEDLVTAPVVVPRVRELLVLKGDAAAGKPVAHLRFEGISFQYTDWEMPHGEKVDSQAAAFLDTATVLADGAVGCDFHGCEIAHTGGYGLWYRHGCKANRLEQCHVHDLGAGAVRLGEMGLPDDEREQTGGNTVHNCFLHDGGRVFHAGVGVWIGRSSHNALTNCEIANFLYSGVSVGWSWGYAPSSANHNRIEHNHIHHLGYSQLSDMGGIYTLGVSPGTVLRGNRIHDVCSYIYGGWGLYTDEGSTGIVMEDNIVYRVKDAAFHQHYGKENVVRNNVLSFSATYGQIRRSRQEEHSSFTIERNVIYATPAQPLGGNWGNDNFTLDDNCYFRPGGGLEFPGGLTFAQWQAKGHDPHSIVADPKFADAAAFDFRLAEDSPALKLGFKPIDATRAGLVGPPEWTELPKKHPPPPLKLPGEE